MKGKDKDKKILKLLYRSLDGDLKDKDQKKLDEALEKSLCRVFFLQGQKQVKTIPLREL